jgi:hypothetical protein
MCTYANEALYNTHNRIYYNVFYKNSNSGIETGISSPPGRYFEDNVFKNNILYKNIAGPEAWYDNILGGTQITHRRIDVNGFVFTTNNILGDVPGEDDVVYNLGIHDWRSLVEMETSYPSSYVNNVEVDPKFIDPATHDFHLDTGSPMVDAGAFLTKTIGAGSGMTLPVEDASYFFDGYGMTDENELPIPGDLVQLEGDTKTARVIDIDYANNTLTLDQPLNWTDGQGVSLAYNGKAPDMGAYEFLAQGNEPVVGDVNGDSAVNALDVQACVNHILGTQDWSTRADVNKDSAINALDIQAIVNIILGV